MTDTTTTTTDTAPSRRRGRKLSDTAPSTDANGCVMHHIRIHETLDNIVRDIVREQGVSFRDAAEEAMMDYANKHGRRVVSITKEIEVRTIEKVTTFADADADSE